MSVCLVISLVDGVFGFAICICFGVGVMIVDTLSSLVENFMKLYCFCVIVLRCHPPGKGMIPISVRLAGDDFCGRINVQE